MSIKDNFTDFRDNIVNLIESKIELVKIDFQENTESLLVKIIYAAIFAILALMLVIFLSILLAVFLNHYLESQYLGYLIVGLLYVVKLVIWIFAKNSVNNQIKNIVSKVVDGELNAMKNPKS